MIIRLPMIIISSIDVLTDRTPKGGQDIDHLGLFGVSGMSPLYTHLPDPPCSEGY